MRRFATQFRELVENLPDLAWTARPDGYPASTIELCVEGDCSARIDISERIVDARRGLSVQSSQEAGTTFTVILPRHSSAATLAG